LICGKLTGGKLTDVVKHKKERSRRAGSPEKSRNTLFKKKRKQKTQTTKNPKKHVP